MLLDDLLQQQRRGAGDIPDHSHGVWEVIGQGLLAKVEELKADEVTTQRVGCFSRTLGCCASSRTRRVVGRARRSGLRGGLEVRQAGEGTTPGSPGSLM